MLRLTPGARWPLLLAAVRDEFMGRAWDPPAAHWPDRPGVRGGRDRLAGGTWLAIDGARPAVAALLNGVRRAEPADGVARPTRGTLPLAALARAPGPVPGISDDRALSRYDGFHLLRADRQGVEIWSWDGHGLANGWLDPGDHIVVNLGADRADDPLVPHFTPLLKATPDADPAPGTGSATAWDGWIDLLRGDGLALTDPRALIIAHRFAGGTYGSTSASLVGLRDDGAVRYDFTATPATPGWYPVGD
jgi:hypothetical protein